MPENPGNSPSCGAGLCQVLTPERNIAMGGYIGGNGDTDPFPYSRTARHNPDRI
jgi:hypothetical protein